MAAPQLPEDLAVKTLSNIQRIDPCANKVLMKATHTALYTFLSVEKRWEKTEVDGAFFIYQRCDRPYYSVIIANRQSLSDFIEPILDVTCVQSNGHFLYMKKDDGRPVTGDIKCVWFYREDECQAVTALLERLVDRLRAGHIPSVDDSPRKSPIPEPPANDRNTLLEMLKAAQTKPKEQQRSVSDNKTEPPTNKPPQSIPEAPQTTSVAEMPALLQKLMIQEQPQMFSHPVPATAMMSADELEKDLVKDLLTTARPKISAVADMANSSSAVSLANFSIRSVHGSEYDGGDAAEIESVMSTRVQVEDPAVDEGSGSEASHSAPPLNKEQFLSALCHLLETDDTFVAQVHQAYVDALNRRLNLDTQR